MNTLANPRIVLLSCFLTPYRTGAESCVEEVALRLSDRYDVTIVTARFKRVLPKKDMLQNRVKVVRVGFGFTPRKYGGLGIDEWMFPFLAPLVVMRLKPDLIHAVLETFAGLALHFCKYLVPKAKRLLTLQTVNRRFLKRMIVRSPHHVTAISSVLMEIAVNFGRKDVKLIPNGIDRDQIPIRQKEPGRILFVGRLREMKGIDTLLRAFANINHDAAHLRIVGEGTERAYLERLVGDLGITDRTTFVGFVPIPDVYEEFAKAEIFCGLSRSEALGNVFLEAQAAGCAVLGTRVGGIPDIVHDGKTGILIPPDDVDAATAALSRLLTDGGLRASLAEVGRENAQRYDWNIITEQYAQVYDSLL